MPASTLHTARLTLIPWQRADLDTLFALWNDPDVRRYLFDGQPVDRQLAAEIVDAAVESDVRTGVALWTVRRQFAGEPTIGFAGLRWLDESQHAAELIYGLAPAHWGQGLATEAAEAVLADAFGRLRFAEIWASADAPNAASFGVMQRLGMTPADCSLAATGLVSYRIDRAAFLRRRSGDE